MAIKKVKQPALRWNPTEVLYAFSGWLTTRKKPIVFGSNYTVGPIAELTNQFIKLNKLPDPRPFYPKLKVPTVHFDDLTNINSVTNAVAEPPLTPDQATTLFASKLREMSPGDQDLALAALLQDLRAERQRKLKRSDEMKRDVERDNDHLQDAVWSLEKIARGDVLVVRPDVTMTLPDVNVKHG